MLVELFELASNNALEHDPKALARLQKLQGKTMVLRIVPLDQAIAVSPQPEGIEFSREIPDNVDVQLTATIGAMLKISRDGMEDADLQPGELDISGDPIVGQRFAQVITELEIDWESFLAEHMGDTPAYWINIAAGRAKEFADESKVQFRSFVNRVVHEDLQLVANEEEVGAFLDAVDSLRADTERLAAKLRRLQNQF